jgi:predicted lipid-binding transport protein (Tim44 family)
MASADPHLAQTTSLANIDAPIALVGEPAAAARSAVRPAAKAATAPARPAAVGRPGYILDDAQIASIKQRLHLTADQERMWPAVEAALRNMAYKRTQQAAGRAAARNVQTAAVDPEAVEGLKSAAVPLIMSFSSEQKDEVRSLVHVMGLDQLAAQF